MARGLERTGVNGVVEGMFVSPDRTGAQGGAEA
jgi:hypothetical protein